ncbi:heat-inducible transcriptional repressor HrcA [Helicovermis profundi]|uniref:Heat-inducible transcription repressor HrcA n=1 Tax=Helicovermis profundi TaxID=3065157 RepID=A0AAU9EJB4_9FIRM|nr:heat-inducible transcriptional repressor HrcA [Clostridia bacterium S502]
MKNSERKMKILQVIIDDFINTAHPVGSRTIAKKYPLGISSATIRNEMADLEELGYLLQPHTSSGRIPSDRGYRLYVDNLMDKDIIIAREKRNIIRELLLNKVIEADDIINQTVQLLSDLTGYVGIVSMPQFNKSRLKNMKFVRISDSKVLMIFVSDSGTYKSLPILLNGISQEVLDIVNDSLLKLLKGITIEEINIKLVNNLKKEFPEYSNFIDYLVPIMRDIFREMDEVELYVNGTGNLFNSPEFKSIEEASVLLNIFENKKDLYELFADVSESISVKIGSELSIKEFSDCSMVATSYKFNGEYIGKIGVIGPKRMNYDIVISVVDYIRETLSEIFSGIYL